MSFSPNRMSSATNRILLRKPNTPGLGLPIICWRSICEPSLRDSGAVLS
jgi:hypothetical protein